MMDDFEYVNEQPLRIRVHVNKLYNLNNANTIHNAELTVPGNYSDEEIGEAVKDFVLGLLDISWIEV